MKIRLGMGLSFLIAVLAVCCVFLINNNTNITYAYDGNFVNAEEAKTFTSVVNVEKSTTFPSKGDATSFWQRVLPSELSAASLTSIKFLTVAPDGYVDSNVDIGGTDLYISSTMGTDIAFVFDGQINAESSCLSMFAGCNKLTAIDFTNFNTSNVTNMYGMFGQCFKLISLDISGFDTSKVTDMSYMFADCWLLPRVGDADYYLNVSAATTLEGMFNSCYALESVLIGNSFTGESSVTNMATMFYNCRALQEVKFGGINASKVTTFANMFDGCNDLLSIAPPNNLTNTQSIVLPCNFNVYTGDNDLTLSTAGVNSVTSATCGTTSAPTVFRKAYVATVNSVDVTSSYGVPLQVSLAGGGYTIVSYSVTFGGVAAEKDVDYTLSDSTLTISADKLVPNIEITSQAVVMFSGDWKLKYNRLTNNEYEYITSIKFLSSAPTGYIKAYDYDENIDLYRSSTLYTDIAFVCNEQIYAAYDCMNMFSECPALKIIQFDNFDTSYANTMRRMFYKCVVLNNLQITGFNTSNVCNMMEMFQFCKALTSLNLTSFDTSKVENMSYMFANLNVPILDLSSFDTTSVTDMKKMFAYSNVKSVDLSSFDASNVEYATNIFSACTSLKMIVAPKNSPYIDLPGAFNYSRGSIEERGLTAINVGQGSTSENDAVYTKAYAVTHNLTALMATEGTTGDYAASYNHAYITTLSGVNGGGLPDAITVKIGGATAVEGTDYTYADGVVTVLEMKVTGNIVIEAIGKLSGAPEISSENGYSSVYDSASHSISVTATHGLSGIYTITYRWYRGGTDETNALGVANTSNTYSVKNFADNGTYYCIVSISDGSVTKSATSNGIIVAVGQKEVGLIWADISDLEYDKNAKTTSVIATGIYEGESCTVTVELSEGNDNVKVGDFTYTAIALSNGNYKLPSDTTSSIYTITPFEIEFKWNSVNDADGSEYVSPYTFNGDAQGVFPFITNAFEGDDVSLTAANNTAINASSTAYVTDPVTLSGADKANYKLPKTNLSIQFIINKMTVAPYVAYVNHKTYDGTTDGDGKIRFVGAKGQESPDVTAKFTWVSADAGTTVINVTDIALNESVKNNYKLSITSILNYDVGSSLKISAAHFLIEYDAVADYIEEYDGLPHGLSYDASKVKSINNQPITIEYSEDGVAWFEELTYTDNTNGLKNVMFRLSAPNHMSFIEGRYIEIYAKEITIAADAKSSVVNTDLVPLTYSCSPELFLGDNFTGALTTSADNSVIADYDITLGSLFAGQNYNIVFRGATYSVTDKRTANVSTLGQNYYYDGNPKPFVLKGAETSDLTVEYYVNGAYTQTAPTNAGRYKVKISRPETAFNYAFSWEDNNGALAICAISVAMPEVDDSVFTYDGTEQVYSIEPSPLYTVSDAIQTNAGLHYVTVSLVDDINYVWSGSISSVDLRYEFLINKATHDMRGVSFTNKTFLDDGTAKSIFVEGTLPDGITVVYSGNAKSEPGIYKVYANFLFDEDNYNMVEPMMATMMINAAELSDKIDGNQTDKPNIIVNSEYGFDPSMSLIIAEVEDASITVGENEIVEKVYNVSLKLDGETTQPEGAVTVKLLIPDALKNASFRIINIYGDELSNVEYVIEGDYARLSANQLSEFAFILIKQPEGLSGGAITGIVIGVTIAVGLMGFAIFWFLIKKKSLADLLAVFKKK